ncbi:MAG: septum formation initiator family protein [Clostridia bacterium]|jgi:cell division protein FtsB|nr:septum formation initiator family protein [Clostridia bacterium]
MEVSYQQVVEQVFPPEKPVITQPKKKRKRTKFRWRPLLLFLVGIYALVAFVGLKWELKEADAQIMALEEKKASLLAEQQQLLEEKEKLNNPVYIERRAREALGLIKPGEKILVPAEPGQVLSLKLEGIDEIGD